MTAIVIDTALYIAANPVICLLIHKKTPSCGEFCILQYRTMSGIF